MPIHGFGPRAMTRVLFVCRSCAVCVPFVCSKNRWRSPTAEQVFAKVPELETASASVSHDADHIVVMEQAHKLKMTASFAQHLAGKRVTVLNIKDDYRIMQPELVASPRAKVGRHVPPG